MGVRLTWTDNNYGEDGHKIYRSTSAMDPQNLPAALATVGPDVTQYDDGTAVDGTKYYYRVSATLGGNEKVSAEIEITPGVLSSVTAKRCAFDFANNHGGTSWMGVRSIEFKLSGSLVSLIDADFASSATTTLTDTTDRYDHKYAFVSGLSKTGALENTTWISGSAQTINQRLNIEFVSPVTFDEIVVNNYHEAGTDTNNGVRDVKITYSQDAGTDATYNAAVTGGVVIFDGQINEHVASDVADDQSLVLTLGGI